jgi:hypothetical protein
VVRLPETPPYEVARAVESGNTDPGAPTRISTGAGSRIGSSRIRTWSLNSVWVKWLSAYEAVDRIYPIVLNLERLVWVAWGYYLMHIRRLIYGHRIWHIVHPYLGADEARPIQFSNRVAQLILKQLLRRPYACRIDYLVLRWRRPIVWLGCGVAVRTVVFGRIYGVLRSAFMVPMPPLELPEADRALAPKVAVVKG